MINTDKVQHLHFKNRTNSFIPNDINEFKSVTAIFIMNNLNKAVVNLYSMVTNSPQYSHSFKRKVRTIYYEHFNTFRLGTWSGWKDISHLSPEEQQEELEFREKKELGWLGI